MANYDCTTTKGGMPKHTQLKGLYRVDIVVNLATLASDKGVTTFDQNDVLQIWDIPAGTLILGVKVKCHTAEGAACLIDVGDGSTVDGFGDGVDVNSTDTDQMSVAADGYSMSTLGGKYYAATDTLDVKLMSAGGGNVAVFTLSILCVDMSVDTPS